MIGLLSTTIAGLALGAAAIELWIARRGLSWLGWDKTTTIVSQGVV